MNAISLLSGMLLYGKGQFWFRNLLNFFFRVDFVSDDDASVANSRSFSMRSQFSEVGNLYAEDRETDGMNCLLAKFGYGF